jgi:hypothetical protein
MKKVIKCYHQLVYKNLEFGTIKCSWCGYAWDTYKDSWQERKRAINKLHIAKLSRIWTNKIRVIR